MPAFVPGRPVGSVDRPIVEVLPTRRINQHVRRVIDAAEKGDQRASATLLAAALLARSAVASEERANG
jgi:hypothetical protein